MRVRAKHTIFLVTLDVMFVLLLAGCRPHQQSEVNDTNVFDWAQLVIENSSVTRDTESLNLIIVNNSPDTFVIGYEFWVEQKEKSTWVVLPFKAGTRFRLRARYVLQDSTSEFKVDLLLLKKPPRPGEYRIVIPAHRSEEKFFLVTLFTVT